MHQAVRLQDLMTIYKVIDFENIVNLYIDIINQMIYNIYIINHGGVL